MEFSDFFYIFANMDKWEEYKKKNEERFKEEAIRKFGSRFDLSRVIYINNKTPIELTCQEHGKFTITPQIFLKSQCGCPKCGKKHGGVIRGIKQRLGLERFIEKARKVHGDKYDYSKVEYINNCTKVCIICPKHGEFWQTPDNHLYGYGCKKCADEKKSENSRFTTERFIEKARKVHGDKYDYSKVEYINATTRVCIICPKHGEFWQLADNHLKGHGCPYCANKYKNTLDFIKASIKVHGDKYIYDEVVYKNANTKVKIICPIHGEFWQEPINHEQNHGCPKCSHPISKWEQEIYEFISSLDIECEQSDRSILNGKEIDIFVPKFNIGIECDGLRWHNEQYRDKNYHLSKTNECRENGVHLIHIFEDEWRFKSDIWKSMFINMFGLIKNKIFARKCEVREVDGKDCREFLNNNHIQGYSNSKINYGLYYNDELVSLMTFGTPRINMGGKKEEGSYELVRFCNKLNTNVIGGASKLFSYFLKKYNPNSIVSYSDKRWSLGNLYKVLGFTHTHDSKPNYFYVYNMNRLNRFMFRKSVLIHEGYDPNKTEHEIMLEREIYRIYDCGTMVWKWKKAKS